MASVVSDVFSAPGLLMRQAFPRAKRRRKRWLSWQKAMRKEISELQLAVEGKIGERHRFLLSVQLRRLRLAEKV